MATFERSCLACTVRGPHCFCGLKVDALKDLQRIGKPVHFSAGHILLREGYPSNGVFLVCSGAIKLTISSSDGKLLILRIGWPGDILGLVPALKGTAYEATAETLEYSQLKVINRVDFMAFMHNFNEVSRHAALAAAQQYEGALLSARRLALSQSAAGKLASTLLDWGKMRTTTIPLAVHPEMPEAFSIPLSFNMPLTHEELGNMAGISRETVTRLLSQFRQEGFLEQQGEMLTLPKPTQMATLYC